MKSRNEVVKDLKFCQDLMDRLVKFAEEKYDDIPLRISHIKFTDGEEAMIKIGDLKKHDEFYFEGEIYKIIGLSAYRSFNNVLCQNIKTKKCKWLDQATEVERNLCDTNPFNDNRFGG